jgi:hypothetical protein
MAIHPRRCRLWGTALAVSVAASGVLTEAADKWKPRLLHFRSAPARSAVERAILGAARRLQSGDCRQLLADLTDAKGVTLFARLEEKQLTLARFLADLRFVDAGDTRKCGQWTSAGFTEPGSLVIFICSAQFVDRAGSLQGTAGEIVIIHEVLHALGLPENGRFPTSDQITAVVRKRCSAAAAL